VKRSPKRRRHSLPARRKAQPAKSVLSTRSSSTASDATEEAVGSPASSASELSDSQSPASGALFVFGALVAVGMLLLGTASVSPARVPWPLVSESLYAYRSNLAAIGLGTIMLALLLLNVTVLL
jgi:hypothetical protein